jgi:hypothetical protein
MAQQARLGLDPAFEAKLTDDAAAAIGLAKEQAARRSHGHAATAHVLLGVLLVGTPLADDLEKLGVTVDAVEAGLSHLQWPEPDGEPRFSPGLRRALKVVEDDVRKLKVHEIGTENLVLGLVHNPQSSANEVLALSRITADDVREVAQAYVVSPALQRDIPAPKSIKLDQAVETDTAAPVTPASAASEAPARLAAVPTHADRPASEDQLGRVRLAEILAERMRRIRGEDTERPATTLSERRAKLRRDRKAARETGSCLIHVHAPWGAGKSSLLNFLGAELRNIDDRRPWQARRARQPHLSQWIVAEFSAWQHQRLEPPWWWLLAAMRRSIRRELFKIDRGRWLVFQLRDVWWHIWNARATVLALALIAGLVVLAWSLDWFGLEGADLTALKTTAVSVTALITFTTLVWGRIRGTSTRLAFGSAAGAVKFMRRAHDPLGVYRRRFDWLVDAADRPIAVIVDDLDRCKPEYVVTLLEGIQTLFADQPVTFVIAADRTWLCQSFATSYSAFEPVVGEPGRPLGYLFLEKTFQISMEIPPMSRTIRNEFWDTLNRPGARPEPDAPEAPLAADAFSEASSEQEVRERARELRGEGKSAEAIQRAAVRRLNAPELQATLEDVLSEYADLLENNPRAMKRLLNAYGIERDRLLRENTTLDADERRRLVLFSIFRMRWPQFAEHLLRRPRDFAWLLAENPSVDDDHPFKRLFDDDDVRRFFTGADGDVTLDADVFARYAGRSS